MSNPLPTILFVCEHGAANIIAASHFNQLAQQSELQLALPESS